jgi:hypothetical protein
MATAAATAGMTTAAAAMAATTTAAIAGVCDSGAGTCQHQQRSENCEIAFHGNDLMGSGRPRSPI